MSIKQKVASLLLVAQEKDGLGGWTRARTIAKQGELSLASVQRIGHNMTKEGPWVLNGQYEAVYSQGYFSVRQRDDYEPPRPIKYLDKPDWFEVGQLNTELDVKRYSSFMIGRKMVLTYDFVKHCISGDVVLAPWQRPAVWSEDQRIRLLDSMIRGVSIGLVTMWERPYGLELEGIALPGCNPPRTRAQFIVDGQQRATTLVMAAQGHLEHWKWNGVEWSEGKGFLTPRMAVMDATFLGSRNIMSGFNYWIRDMDGDMINRIYKDFHAIERTDLDLMVLGGSTTEMIETYRRLATHGSPHSPEDLAIMESWATENVQQFDGVSNE